MCVTSGTSSTRATRISPRSSITWVSRCRERAAFARRYFEDLAAQVGPPFMLVFDNYQEVSPRAPLHDALLEGIKVLPPGFRTLVLSRTPPPPPFAGTNLARLDWEAMQLTGDEVEGIERLRRRTRGAGEGAGSASRWAAGLVLMLEREDAARPANASPESDPQQLFDHYAAEIFARRPAATRRALLASVLLPKITAPMLAQLAGDERAGDVLEELHAKNYFTLKHGASYEYHPLFRDFLLRQAKQALSASELQALRRQAAALAEADGQLGVAAELLRACGDFAGVARLLLSHAQTLVEQGRSQLVESWLAGLPAELRAAQPWLAYWHGICRLPFSPEQARGHFERAHERFKRDGDRVGLCIAWCAIVDSFVYEWGNFNPLARWLKEAPREVPGELEAQVACGMFLALMYAEPTHADMPRWESRTREIVLSGAHPRLQVKVGNSLLIYYTWWTGELDKAGELVQALRAQIERPGVPPLMQITWNAMAAGYYWMIAANAECVACVEHALEMGRINGVHTWDRLLCSQGVFGTLSAGDRDAARRYLERMEMSASMSRPMDHAMYHYLSAWYRLEDGDTAGARDSARRAVEMAEEAGAAFPAAVMRNDYGRVLCRLGEKERGLALIRRSRTEGRLMRARTIEYLSLIAEAEAELRDGDERAALEPLARGLAVARAQGFVNHTWWSAEVMRDLYGLAAAHGIEPAFVAGVAAKRGISTAGFAPCGT
jgi:ATP/maltotriose-dependent transcriptional regulator MalT